MSLIYAKIRLAEWGRWSRDDSLGYPKKSAMLGGGGRSTDVSPMPPHVALVDLIVRQMLEDPRRVVIVHYTQTGTADDKALRIDFSLGTYRRLLRQAQDHVGIELDYAESCCVVSGEKANSG